MRLLLTLLALGLVLKRRPGGGHHGDDGDGVTPRPGDGDADGQPTRYKDIDAGGSMSSAQDAVQARAERGRPRDLDGDGTPDVGNPAVKGPAAKIPARIPHDRHFFGNMSGGTPKGVNTVVVSGKDSVRADVQAINEGRATWNPQTSRYEIGGRSYGWESNGTLFPDSGPGFHKLDRGPYGALKALIKHGGDLDAAMAGEQNPFINQQANWDIAAEVYRRGTEARRERDGN